MSASLHVNFRRHRADRPYPIQGLANQRWYYTDDNHIAITGGSICLDGAGGGCGLGGCAPGTKTVGTEVVAIFSIES